MTFLRTPLPQIDYVARDFESIKESLVSYLQQNFPDDFTDFTESQLGIALLEMVAYAFEILSFTQDRQINEVFIETARERSSIIRLASLLGYKPAGATAASINVFLSTETLSQYAGPVVIEEGSQLQAGGLVFEVDQTYTIQRIGGGPSYLYNTNGDTAPIVVISATQGETVESTFTATGNPFLRLQLPEGPFIENSLSVAVDNLQWTVVESLVLGDPDNPENTNIVEVLLDSDDVPTLAFGDGVSGGVPIAGTNIVARYKVGGGDAGNISGGAISQPIPAIHNGVSPITVPGISGSGTGGSDRETLSHIRLFAPQWAKTNDRAVTKNDYLTLCNGYSDNINGTVAKAGVIAEPSDGISNVVTVYTWAFDAAGNLSKASNALKNALREFLNDRRTISVSIGEVQDGINIPVDLDILIRVDRAFNKTEVQQVASNVIDNLFTDTRVLYGNELRLAWIYDALIEIPGISWAHAEGPNVTKVETDVVVDIESGVLSGSQPTPRNEVRIPAPSGRVANHYANYRLWLGSRVRRVVTSTAESGSTVVLTLEDDFDPPAVAGEAFRIAHPRRVKLGASASSVDDFYNNNVIVIASSTFGIDDQIRTIADYDGTEKVALIDEDWDTSPQAGFQYKITPDFRATETQALVRGTVDIQIVS